MATEDDAVDNPQLTDLAQAVVAQMFAPGNLRKAEIVAEGGLTGFIKNLIAIAIPLGVGIIAPFAEGIAQGENLAAPAMARLNRLAVSDLLGVDIPESTFAGPGTGKRVAADMAIGDAILKAIAAPGGAITASDDPAKKYLSLMVGYSLEGWLEGWMFQAVSQLFSLGQINLDKFAELDDILAQALGFGRLSSRILRPYTDTLIQQPLEWKVNKTYTPKLLTAAEVARQFFRGRWTREQVNEELGRQGYSPARIEALLNSARKTVSASDILYLQRDGGMPRATAETMLKEMGFDSETITLLFAAEDTRRYRAMLEQTANVAGAAYIDGHLSSAEFQSLLSTIYPQAEERDLFLQLVNLKKLASQKRLSKGEVEIAVKRNILSMLDYRRYLEREGYDGDSIATLELLLRDEIAGEAENARKRAELERQREEERQRRAADAERRRLELEARNAARIPPLGDIRRAVVLGVVTADRYVEQLRALKYPAADIDFLTELLALDRQAQLDKEERAEELANARPNPDLPVAVLERAAVAGVMPIADYGNILRDRGYDDAERGILVSLAQQKLDARIAAEELRAQLADERGARGLQLAQAERATKRGLWSLQDFRAWLDASGFEAFAAGVLVELMRADLADLAEAETRRAAIGAELRARDVSLSDVEDAVLRGLRTMDDYRAVLARFRYSLTDQALLVDLLTARLDERRAAELLRADVASATADQRLSLKQIERAVQLGTVTLDAYRAYLAEAGYRDFDADVLVASLVADVQAARADDVARAQVLAGAGVQARAIEDVETAIVAGDETLTAYVALLRSLGVDDRTVERLARRLDEMVSDRADALALETAVDVVLKPKQLSSAQWAAAVREGLRSIEDYAAFLALEGYGDAEVQILATLLARSIEKSTTKTPREGGTA